MTRIPAPNDLARTEASELSASDFAFVQTVALDQAGLLLPTSKRVMVQSRLSRRVRATGCKNLPEYIALLKSGAETGETQELISVLTTNVTSFFREQHHFETLADEILPLLLRQATDGARVRLWSAGCSSGEEAYSLAMLILHLAPNALDLDVRILATDVDRAVLKTAQDGVYKRADVRDIPRRFDDLCRFETIDDATLAIPDQCRRLISFKHLNLHASWPMTRPFDVIMCRNVVIYFDADHQARLWPRFRAALNSTGWLFLGHSERIHPLNGSGFVGRGLTAYQKAPSASPKQAD